ncbi:MAG: integrase arm-type DNA-binding domain-containing protein [Pseudomonadota bacterium]
MKLTAKKCDAAAYGKDPTKLFDGRGLYLFLHKNGSKYWRYKYKSPIKGKEDTLSLGVYPETSLAEAREKHQAAHKLVTEGTDPKENKKEEQAKKIVEANNTFEVIAREWHNHKLSEWSEVNAEQTIKRLEKDVFPIIGKKPIKTITHKDLLDLAQSVKQRGANELAKRIIQMSKHIFQYAIITGRAEKNIAQDLKGIIKPKPANHFAAIEAKELPQFIKDLEDHRPNLKRQTYLAVKFMMLTFVRTGEMIGAEWDEFDFEEKVWLIPASRMKMKKEHIVPLSTQSLEILNELGLLHNHPQYVFPSRISHDKHMSNNAVLMALDRMGYRGKMTGHGFRSLAMSTIMEKLGYRREVPDAQLAHAKRGDVAKAYERAKYLGDRTKMMQEWADYIESIK